ncbi:MAG: hypothetical protein QXT63_00175 [Thermoplasmata archaeon]
MDEIVGNQKYNFDGITYVKVSANLKLPEHISNLPVLNFRSNFASFFKCIEIYRPKVVYVTMDSFAFIHNGIIHAVDSDYTDNLDDLYKRHGMNDHSLR